MFTECLLYARHHFQFWGLNSELNVSPLLLDTEAVDILLLFAPRNLFSTIMRIKYNKTGKALSTIPGTK